MKGITNVSRRKFLKVGGQGAGALLVLGVDLDAVAAPWTGFAPGLGAQQAAFEPGAFVSISADGAIRLTVHRSNMGQDVRTSCTMLMAEELDVDLSQVTVVQADGHPRYGDQNTDGSRSIKSQYVRLRQAGAAAKQMLKRAAATEWGVEVAELDTSSGTVHHRASDRSATYGVLVPLTVDLPVPEDPLLKSPDEFRLIGQRTPGIDVPDMLRGTAVYAADVTLEGMRFASLERSPTRGGRALEWNDEAALAVPGVLRVMALAGTRLTNASVAVVAENTWAALQGRRALDVTWDEGEGPHESSAAKAADLAALSDNPGTAYRQEGDVDLAFAAADRIVEARFTGPYLVHAPMEPMAVLASVTPDFAELWAPTQSPQWARGTVAQALGLQPEQVRVHVTLLGGGFGRKSKPDFVLEAALLARDLGEPVRVQWTREDEVRHGFYRAQNHQLIRASIQDGEVTGWLHRSTFPPIGSTFNPANHTAGAAELDQGLTNMPYRISHTRMEHGEVGSSFRIGWMRSVCNTFHARAVNCFMDELAAELGEDPIDFHLRMLGEPRIVEMTDIARNDPDKLDTGRLSNVIQLVRERSGWDTATLPDGHGLGFAAHYSFNTFIATVVRASIEDGRVRAHEIHTAVDCGTRVNPDTIEAQLEGAAVFGLSYALYGKITAEDGRIVQSNFHDYPLLRIGDMPRVHVHQVESSAAPTGIGEPGVPPIPPALVNAVYAATGRRVYDLPLADQDWG